MGFSSLTSPERLASFSKPEDEQLLCGKPSLISDLKNEIRPKKGHSVVLTEFNDNLALL